MKQCVQGILPWAQQIGALRELMMKQRQFQKPKSVSLSLTLIKNSRKRHLEKRQVLAMNRWLHKLIYYAAKALILSSKKWKGSWFRWRCFDGEAVVCQLHSEWSSEQHKPWVYDAQGCPQPNSGLCTQSKSLQARVKGSEEKTAKRESDCTTAVQATLMQ